MFIVSYSLINRSLLLWFPRPLEIASDETQKLLNDLGRSQLPRLRGMALQAQAEATRPGADFCNKYSRRAPMLSGFLDRDGKVIRGGIVCDDQAEDRSGAVACSQMFQGSICNRCRVEWKLGGR